MTGLQNGWLFGDGGNKVSINPIRPGDNTGLVNENPLHVWWWSQIGLRRIGNLQANRDQVIGRSDCVSREWLVDVAVVVDSESGNAEHSESLPSNFWNFLDMIEAC